MGWHLFVLHASGPAATAATLAGAGYLATALRVTIDEAVAEIDDLAPGGVAVVDDPGPGIVAVARLVEHDDLPLALSADGGEAVTFLWQAVTDTYVLSVFRDGHPRRRLVRVDGEVVVDEGPALPIETGLDWSDDEAALFAVAESVVGEPIGTDTWMARRAVVHRRRRRS
ncbi:MAG TPA: hypothetical protein VF228_10635 [Iamia sp.]